MKVSLNILVCTMMHILFQKTKYVNSQIISISPICRDMFSFKAGNPNIL